MWDARYLKTLEILKRTFDEWKRFPKKISSPILNNFRFFRRQFTCLLRARTSQQMDRTLHKYFTKSKATDIEIKLSANDSHQIWMLWLKERLASPIWNFRWFWQNSHFLTNRAPIFGFHKWSNFGNIVFYDERRNWRDISILKMMKFLQCYLKWLWI